MSNNDKCVICNAETPYTVDIHIKLREHYVEGAGQLCAVCFDDVYGGSLCWEDKCDCKFMKGTD